MANLNLEVWKEPSQNSPASSKLSMLTEYDIDALLMRYSIPKKFIKYSFPMPNFLQRFIGEKEHGACLLGPSGTGKSTALVSLVRQWLREQNGHFKTFVKSWKFVVYPEFIMELQNSYKHDHGEKTALDLLRELAKVPFLIIDDLGAEKLTDYV